MRARPLEKMMRRGPTNQAPPQTVRETNRSESVQGLDLAVDLAPNNPHHLWLSNPVMIASGTFGYDGYGRGITEDMNLGDLGAVGGVHKPQKHHFVGGHGVRAGGVEGPGDAGLRRLGWLWL